MTPDPHRQDQQDDGIGAVAHDPIRQLRKDFGHFAREVTEIFPKLAYGIMSYGPYSIILLILAVGIWRHRTRVRRYGRYRSWRISSSPLPDRLPTPQPNG